MLDGSPGPSRGGEFQERDPDLHWLERDNRGFGAGANELLRFLTRLDGARPDAVLILNPDVTLEPAFAESLLGELAQRPNVAIASGKLKRPDGTLDSAGIELPRHRRPRDRGSDQPDHGQFDAVERVFGVCGAAMMIRTSAIRQLAIDGEVFDEEFFLYREDTDLCWRAHRLGFDVLYVPRARASHVRHWRPGRREARMSIAPSNRRHSFKNHYLQMLKNDDLVSCVRDLPLIVSFEVLRFGYALLTDPRVLPAYFAAIRHVPSALAKRRILSRRRGTAPAAHSLGAPVPTPSTELS